MPRTEEEHVIEGNSTTRNGLTDQTTRLLVISKVGTMDVQGEGNMPGREGSKKKEVIEGGIQLQEVMEMVRQTKYVSC